MIKLRRFFLIMMLVVLPPTAAAFAQTATPTPTATPDYRGLVQIGAVELLAGPPPSSSTGWLVCDGSAVSRTTYALLFAAIGTTFGAGDGTTTFNLPDLRGRVPVGSGAGTGLTARTLGQTLGNETHTLTVTEMPSHTHTITDPGHAHNEQITNPAFKGGAAGANSTFQGATSNNANRATTDSTTTGITINSTGGGAAFGIMQPSLVINYVIWAGTVAMPSIVAEQTVVITVVVVFPTHTATPTPTPTLTPTSGPSPTPTVTPSPTGLAAYESVVNVAGQDVLLRYEAHPVDFAWIVYLSLFLVLAFGAFGLYLRRRRS